MKHKITTALCIIGLIIALISCDFSKSSENSVQDDADSLKTDSTQFTQSDSLASETHTPDSVEKK